LSKFVADGLSQCHTLLWNFNLNKCSFPAHL